MKPLRLYQETYINVKEGILLNYWGVVVSYFDQIAVDTLQIGIRMDKISNKADIRRLHSGIVRHINRKD